jgi:hypothetical protein
MSLREQMERSAAEIAEIVKTKLELDFSGKVGFCLLLFDFGEHGNLAYMANARRSDVLNLLAEFEGVLKAQRPPGES